MHTLCVHTHCSVKYGYMAKKRLPDRACLVCARMFSPTRTWHMFCSSSCRFDSHRNEAQQEYACVYCGLGGDSVDHVPPSSVRPSLIALGIASRYPFVEVRCCRECNSLLGNRAYWTVPQRKHYIKAQLKRRYLKFLRIPDWTELELARLSLTLRDHTLHGLAVRDITRQRIAH